MNVHERRSAYQRERFKRNFQRLLGAGGKASLDHLDGGKEIYDSCMVVRTVTESVSRISLLFHGMAVLQSVFFLILLAALPVILIITVIYHSPFAILFPSVSQTDTIQQVLDGYVSEFDTNIRKELEDLTGYDESELHYENAQYQAVDDIYDDILSVYMVRYGFGVIATDMTPEAREHLKQVFQDMCHYTLSEREQPAETNVPKNDIVRIKEVIVDLKGYEDMIPIYGFDAEEQAVLRELIDL